MEGENDSKSSNEAASSLNDVFSGEKGDNYGSEEGGNESGEDEGEDIEIVRHSIYNRNRKQKTKLNDFFFF